MADAGAARIKALIDTPSTTLGTAAKKLSAGLAAATVDNDRFSGQVATASDARGSRRTLIKGAAVATAVLPFAPGATTYAANRVRHKLATDYCLGCFAAVTKQNQSGAFLKACLETSPKRTLLAPKGGKGGGGSKGGKGGKKPPKTPEAVKPAPAAKNTSCEASARQVFLYELELCRKSSLCSKPAPPPEVQPDPVIPGAGVTGCAAGTTKCTDTLCCYGGDACCPCSGDMICCAGVIGCTCC